jgi:hypothetical protein
MSLAKRINHTKEIVDAKAHGWKFTTDGKSVLIIPPDGMSEEEAIKAQRRIAQSVVDVAVRHIGYCYRGCR